MVNKTKPEHKIVKKDHLFSEIFRDEFVRLCYYANTFIKEIDTSKDIVQDVFISMWEIDISGKDRDELLKILFKSVRNRSLDYLKKQKVRNRYRTELLQNLIKYSNIDYTNYEVKELSVKIEKELKKLPKQTFNIFEMSRVEGKTYSEIAAKLGVSVKTIEFHVSKALAALREGLKEYLVVIVPAIIFISGLF